MASPKKVYAVARGKKPGIYQDWFGTNGAESQIKGFPGALYKGFFSMQEANTWLQAMQKSGSQMKLEIDGTSPVAPKSKPILEVTEKKEFLLFTDGACTNNPGPGGYGVVLQHAKVKQEFSDGFRKTTNNRMELLACIVGLKALKHASKVILYSDSQYVINGLSKGWALRWRSHGWKRNKEEIAENVDLWAKLLELCDQHEVHFKWVKGHAGHPENERCDQLARKAIQNSRLLIDENYETSQTQSVAFRIDLNHLSGD